MRYSEKQITPPTAEPVTPGDMNWQEYLDDPEDAANCAELLASAREYCETVTKRQFVTATWQMALDRFPRSTNYNSRQETYRESELPVWDRAIYVPRAPLISVDWIKYIDPSGVQQTWDPSLYIVDNMDEPGRITPAFGQFWPVPQVIINSVLIQFQAGYGAPAAVPSSLKRAIKLLASHWFANREPINDAPTSEIPFMVTNLLNSKKWGSYILTPGHTG